MRSKGKSRIKRSKVSRKRTQRKTNKGAKRSNNDLKKFKKLENKLEKLHMNNASNKEIDETSKHLADLLKKIKKSRVNKGKKSRVKTKGSKKKKKITKRKSQRGGSTPAMELRGMYPEGLQGAGKQSHRSLPQPVRPTPAGHPADYHARPAREAPEERRTQRFLPSTVTLRPPREMWHGRPAGGTGGAESAGFRADYDEDDDDEDLYVCENDVRGCGFRGTYEEVEAHELSCPHAPRPAREAPDEYAAHGADGSVPRRQAAADRGGELEMKIAMEEERDDQMLEQYFTDEPGVLSIYAEAKARQEERQRMYDTKTRGMSPQDRGDMLNEREAELEKMIAKRAEKDRELAEEEAAEQVARAEKKARAEKEKAPDEYAAHGADGLLSTTVGYDRGLTGERRWVQCQLTHDRISGTTTLFLGNPDEAGTADPPATLTFDFSEAGTRFFTDREGGRDYLLMMIKSPPLGSIKLKFDNQTIFDNFSREFAARKSVGAAASTAAPSKKHKKRKKEPMPILRSHKGTGDPDDAAAPEREPQQSAVRDELVGLKLIPLIKHAKEIGVDEDELDHVQDKDDVIELILAHISKGKESSAD